MLESKLVIFRAVAGGCYTINGAQVAESFHTKLATNFLETEDDALQVGPG